MNELPNLLVKQKRKFVVRCTAKEFWEILENWSYHTYLEQSIPMPWAAYRVGDYTYTLQRLPIPIRLNKDDRIHKIVYMAAKRKYDRKEYTILGINFSVGITRGRQAPVTVRYSAIFHTEVEEMLRDISETYRSIVNPLFVEVETILR